MSLPYFVPVHSIVVSRDSLISLMSVYKEKSGVPLPVVSSCTKYHGIIYAIVSGSTKVVGWLTLSPQSHANSLGK